MKNNYWIVFLFSFLVLFITLANPFGLRSILIGIPFIIYGLYGIIEKKILTHLKWEKGKIAQFIGTLYFIIGILFITGLIYTIREFFKT